MKKTIKGQYKKWWSEMTENYTPISIPSMLSKKLRKKSNMSFLSPQQRYWYDLKKFSINGRWTIPRAIYRIIFFTQRRSCTSHTQAKIWQATLLGNTKWANFESTKFLQWRTPIMNLYNCWMKQANYDALAVPVNLKKKEIYQLTRLNL